MNPPPFAQGHLVLLTDAPLEGQWSIIQLSGSNALLQSVSDNMLFMQASVEGLSHAPATINNNLEPGTYVALPHDGRPHEVLRTDRQTFAHVRNMHTGTEHIVALRDVLPCPPPTESSDPPPTRKRQCARE